MLTAAQVAIALGVSARDVLELAKSGRLPCYRFTRMTVRFDPAEVERYRASLPKPRPHVTARELREYERLRRLAPPQDRPPALSAHHQAIADRRVRRLRMAPWADPKAIRALRDEARRLTAETGVPHHVDHVIPLQGDFVSGLHVETNMQILTGTANIRKRNRFEPC